LDFSVPRERLLETLIGIRASKPTYYREYRDNARRLDRAITSIANISTALCTTTSGVPSLAQAVVRVAAQHFEADWAVVLLNQEHPERWVAHRINTDISIVEEGDIPPYIDEALQDVLRQQRLIFMERGTIPAIVGAPMFLGEQIVGALVVTSAEELPLDEREFLVLQTLANHAAVAVDNARLYEDSERLRTQATELYEEAYRQKAELEEKNQQLEKVGRWLAVARQNEIVNGERSRIARDLHDSVAQYLLSIGMNLEWCRAQLDPSTPVYERISVAKELARNAVERIRATIFELSSVGNSQTDLVTALEELATEFQTATGLHVRVRIRSKAEPLPPKVHHALYQITQEALFNAYKHAQARSVNISVRFTPTTIYLTITDNGIGIPTDLLQSVLNSSDQQSGRYGLRNMCERAKTLSGTCTIRSVRSGGTEVYVCMPTELQ
jgi:signal transduction histidine kinase